MEETDKDCRDWKLTTVDPQERSTWRSNFVHIKGLVFCFLLKVSINSRTLAIISFHPLFRKKSHLLHKSGTVATITQPTKILLGRYTAGFIIQMNIFRSKKVTKILPFLTARYTFLCTRRLQPPCNDFAVGVQWISCVRNGTWKSND